MKRCARPVPVKNQRTYAEQRSSNGVGESKLQVSSLLWSSSELEMLTRHRESAASRFRVGVEDAEPGIYKPWLLERGRSRCLLICLWCDEDDPSRQKRVAVQAARQAGSTIASQLGWPLSRGSA